MNRKAFIKTCGYTWLGGTALLTFLQSCASTVYVAQTTSENNRILINKKEFLRKKNDKTVTRPFVLVRSEKFNYPICVYKIGEETYSALLMQCTHKGCELKPQGSFLVCPCHGSEFTNKGFVQSSPAEQPLQTFKTTSDHENIYIHL